MLIYRSTADLLRHPRVRRHLELLLRARVQLPPAGAAVFTLSADAGAGKTSSRHQHTHADLAPGHRPEPPIFATMGISLETPAARLLGGMSERIVSGR